LHHCLNHFRGPSEQTIKRILLMEGFSPADGEVYGELEFMLRKLIGRRYREEKSLEFFKLQSSQLRRKLEKELTKRTEMIRREVIESYKKEIARSREQLAAEVMSEASKIFIIDRQTYEILKSLSGGDRELDELKRVLGLKNDELLWRLNTLTYLALVHSLTGGKYSLSNVGREVLMKAEKFKECVYTINDVKRIFALDAVGDESRAEALLTLVNNGRVRNHGDVIGEEINKLAEKWDDDLKKLSQSFFNRRECGAKHVKHLIPGARIADHKALGRLLMVDHLSQEAMRTRWKCYPKRIWGD
ncbi:MAG: hypothetical protein FGF48_11045, partial [Candidatus Brockarchaeota archaeon]|nr:hypothetical protein [Candidatus Brockarchaeota archaeon]